MKKSDQKPLKVTVITVCLNADQLIERTIESVLSQSHETVEYIIIDGGSTDNTIKVIGSYGKKISTFISESDNGIYHAMNKGLRLAQGDLIVFLNAGDLFAFKHTLELVANEASKCYANIYFANYLFVSKNGIDLVDISCIDNKIELLRKGFGHPSTFYRKEAFEMVGDFSEKYRIVSDADWNFKALMKVKLTYKIINAPLSIFYHGGISSNEELHKKEHQQMIETYFSGLPLKLLSSHILRKLTKSVIFGHLIKKIFCLSLNKC